MVVIKCEITLEYLNEEISGQSKRLNLSHSSQRDMDSDEYVPLQTSQFNSTIQNFPQT